MDATPVGPVARPFDENGSAVAVSVPTTARTTLEHVVGPVQLPSEPRLSAATLAGLAAAAGAAALALGAWAFFSSLTSDDSNGTRAAARDHARPASVISLLSRPTTQRVAFAGSAGGITLAVGANGRGILVLDGFSPVPAGKSYEAWILGPKAKSPASGAVFSGTTGIVPLSAPVRHGSTVSITIERAGGVSAPTHGARLVVRRT